MKKIKQAAILHYSPVYLSISRTVNPQRPRGRLHTTTFNTQNSTFPPENACMFSVDLRTNNDYFPIQH